MSKKYVDSRSTFDRKVEKVKNRFYLKKQDFLLKKQDLIKKTGFILSAQTKKCRNPVF